MVGPHGEVLAQAQQFAPTVLRGTVQPRVGLPPYARFGNWLIVVIGLLGAAGAALVKRHRSSQA